MKKLFGLLTIILISLFFINSAQAQFDKLKQKVKDKVNQRADDKTDKAIDKTLDDAEKSTKTNGDKTSTDKDKTTEDKNAVSGSPNIKTYRNYDFVPGDKIIFQSQLVDEKTGEIPSQFILTHGQMDVQIEDGENVLHVPKGEGATLTPRMTNQTFMPDQFTVEFDFKNEGSGVGHLSVDFGSRVYYAGIDGVMPGMSFHEDNSMDWTLGGVNYPEGLNVNYEHSMQWHHVAIAVNKTVGKVYIDQFRVANVNNLTGKANEVTIDVQGYENSWLKNIRIASGGIDIYKKISTDSKIVMHGILFDVDKATLKPESMGSINQIYDVLTKDASLKFEIDGHTDNSGTSAHNLSLSQQRADAVKTQLVKMGIDAGRLTTKGFGDSKPISDNTTPEGKANNRRVEFVKNN